MTQWPGLMPSSQCFQSRSLHLAVNLPTPTESLLKEVFAMLREIWACDFLFKMDAAADVSVLTSPAELQYALILNGFNQIFDTGREYEGMFNMNFEYRWLIIPVDSVGELHGSIVVQSHQAFREGNPCQKFKNTAILHMIQNSLTGDAILCVDKPWNNVVNMILFSRRSRSLRKRVVLKFRRDSVLASLIAPLEPEFCGILNTL